jgi:hypothetical protein
VVGRDTNRRWAVWPWLRATGCEGGRSAEDDPLGSDVATEGGAELEADRCSEAGGDVRNVSEMPPAAGDGELDEMAPGADARL